MSGETTIEWHGHSYFTITYSDYKLIVDPHDGGSLNIPTHRSKADAVLITHNHYDHNAVEVVDSPTVVKWKRGSFNMGPFRIQGLASYHDKAGGELRGENTIYVIEAGGMRIAHLGDIGHLPDEDLSRSLSGIDILMVPVGGVYTIDASEAWEIVKELEPRLVIPMHFWVPYSTLPLDPLDRFINIAKTRRLRLEEPVIRVTPEVLPGKPTVVVFPAPRGEE